MAKEYEYKAKYDRDLKISYAQAWNLAVQSCLQQTGTQMFPPEWTLDQRQEWFFQRLTVGWTTYADLIDEGQIEETESGQQPLPSKIDHTDELSMT